MREFIDISLQESVAERWHSVGWAGLTDAEREIGCVYLWHGHLLHGGLPVALDKLDRSELNHAVAGLTRIAAPNAASLLARAIDGASAATLEEVESELASSEIAAIRLELPERYAIGHSEEFPGPRSLVELRELMQLRGIQEKPDRLVNFERLAASDASSTERRCATCGQPVPEYKSKCRRCGRAYVDRPPSGQSPA